MSVMLKSVVESNLKEYFKEIIINDFSESIYFKQSVMGNAVKATVDLFQKAIEDIKKRASGDKFIRKCTLDLIVALEMEKCVHDVFFKVYNIKVEPFSRGCTTTAGPEFLKVHFSYFKTLNLLPQVTFSWEVDNIYIYPELSTHASQPLKLVMSDWEKALNRIKTNCTIKFNDGEILSAHKGILELRSDYFFGLFNSGMAEARDGVVKFDTDQKVGKEVIRFLYTGMLSEAQGDLAFYVAIFRKAHEIDCQDLQALSIQSIFKKISSPLTISEFEILMGVGVDCSNEKILTLCLQFANELDVEINDLWSWVENPEEIEILKNLAEKNGCDKVVNQLNKRTLALCKEMHNKLKGATASTA